MMTYDFASLSLDDSPDAVIATSRDGTVLYWSKGAESMMGFPVTEILGQPLDRILPPSDRHEEYKGMFELAWAKGAACHEAICRKKDGTLIYADVSARTIDGPDGLQFLISSFKDVTQLKVLRDARLLETRFGNLLESLPDAIVMVNTMGRIVLANSQAEKLFGYTPGELRGSPVETLIPSRFHSAHTGHRTDYSQHPRQRPMGEGLELFGLRKDGSEFPVEISLSPVETPEGTLISSAIRDITERKRFERELQEKNAALLAANEELESFSYSISHDLRAPLRALDGYARILDRQDVVQLPEEVRHALKRIRENAAHMGCLVNGLLELASLGRRPLASSSVSLAELARAAADDLSPETAGRRVEINISDLPRCRGDSILLKQVLTNLLSNAVKYTRGRDPAVITVGFRNDDSAPVYFVQDNGAGFDMDYSDKLFRVFQRLHRSEDFEGTGVGLAIVQRIIQKHGGRIWAEGRVGAGATFSFTLPNNSHE
jgi:PAS domain S-box-containing protein